MGKNRKNMYLCKTMELKRIAPEEYSALFDHWAPHVYNTVAFNELNRSKVCEVHYLAFCDPQPRLGIVLGVHDGCLMSPFSAPFGGFTLTSGVSTDDLRAAVKLLIRYGKENGCRVEITLPPAIYAPSAVGMQEAALSGCGELMWSDVNHHRLLDFTPGEAASGFKRKSRAHLRQAEGNGFLFEMLKPEAERDVRRFYGVISLNHSALGYPVKMSLSQVMSTAPLVDSRFMILTRDDEDVASAMVNRVTDRVCQLIYWGDILRFRPLRPMNLLAALLCEACRGWGFGILDFGPSSERGIPSPGLCRFKEGLGCIPSPKLRFRL